MSLKISKIVLISKGWFKLGLFSLGSFSLTFWDHWLDGERVAGLHDAHGLILRVVGHVGSAVEQLVNSWKKLFQLEQDLLKIALSFNPPTGVIFWINFLKYLLLHT